MGGSGSKLSAEQSLVTKTAQIRSLPDNILNMVFSKANIRDILDVSNVDKCGKYVFLTKDALDKLFYQINVEPKGGIPIYFAPVEDLTLTRPRNTSQEGKKQARNLNCMRVAFFYIRAFQIVSALSLNLIDTLPVRELGTAATVSSGIPTRGEKPGKPRMLGGALMLGGARKLTRATRDDTENYQKIWHAVVQTLPTQFREDLIREEDSDTNREIYFVNPFTLTRLEKEKLYITLIEEAIQADGQGNVIFSIEYNYQITQQNTASGSIDMQSKKIETEADKFYITFEITFKDPSNPNIVKGQLKVGDIQIPYEFAGTFETSKRAGETQYKYNWLPPRQGASFSPNVYLKQIYNAMRERAGIQQLPVRVNTTTAFPQAAAPFAPIQFAAAPAPVSSTVGPIAVGPAAPAPRIMASAPSTITAAGPTVAPFVTSGIGAPQATVTGPIQASEFIALNELKKRLLDEKVSPKAYAVGRALMLLNPSHPLEQKKVAQYTSDVCRPNRAPPSFDTRLRAMPMPNSQSRSNIYFQSLISLFFDKFTVQDDTRLVIEQTPPGRDALMQASYDLGTMFYVAGGAQEQLKFLYEAKQIKANPNLCPANGALLQLNPSKEPKIAEARAKLIKALNGVIAQLLKLQETYNKSALQILKKMFFDTKEKEFRMRPEVYKGGIPFINKIAEEARALLLIYYKNSEAFYTLGIKLILEARAAKPDLIQYANI